MRELLIRWKAYDPEMGKYGATAGFVPSAIPEDRRHEFYAELEELYDPYKHGFDPLPDLEPDAWGVSDAFLLAALKERDDPNHGDLVAAAVAEALKDGDTSVSLNYDYPELTPFPGGRVQAVRLIARAMKMEPTELARQISEKIGEPIPGCFKLKSNKPALVIPSLSQARAATAKPAFLVDGLIPDRRVTLVHGPTSMGKTYWALEVGAAVATGRPAFGHFQINRPGFVVFYAGEDDDDVKYSRLPALEAAYGPLEDKLTVVEYALPLDNPAELERNLEALRQLAAQQPIAAIINDTYRMSIYPQQINDGAVAAAAYQQFKAIANEFGCAVLVTAHSPKGNDNELAGSQELENLVPWSLLVRGKKAPDKRLIAVNTRQGEKARVGKPITPFSVDCQPVPLPDNGATDLILTGYREKTAKPEPDVVELAHSVAEMIPPAEPVNGADRDAEILRRKGEGQSNKQIATEMGIRRSTVIAVVREALQ